MYTSPLERAVETAEPIAERHGLEAQRAEALGEFRVGEWEGACIQDMDSNEEWKRFNAFRSGLRPPGGELMIEMQTRMVRQIHCLCGVHPDQTVALVSHADPIRSVMGHFLGAPLDLLLRLEISPASVSALRVEEWGASVMCVNSTEEIPA